MFQAKVAQLVELLTSVPFHQASLRVDASSILLCVFDNNPNAFWMPLWELLMPSLPHTEATIRLAQVRQLPFTGRSR
jgi:hypothetical protein